VNLASVIAAEVHPAFCLTYLPADVVISSQSVRAIITTLGGPIKYWIDNTAPTSTKAGQTEQHVRQSIINGSSLTKAAAVLADSVQSADIVLHVGAQGVSIDRRDPTLQHLHLELPLVKDIHVNDYFPACFHALARFHDFISLENTANPFAEVVDVSLHVLPSVVDEEEHRLAGAAVPFEKGEATIRGDGSHTLYAVVLENRGDTPLFPYV
jgi:hypothetical protein